MSISVDIFLYNPVQELFSSINLLTILRFCDDHSSNSILYHCPITPWLPGGCSCPTRPYTASCHITSSDPLLCSWYSFDWERSMADQSQGTQGMVAADIRTVWHQHNTPCYALDGWVCVLVCLVWTLNPQCHLIMTPPPRLTSQLSIKVCVSVWRAWDGAGDLSRRKPSPNIFASMPPSNGQGWGASRDLNILNKVLFSFF